MNQELHLPGLVLPCGFDASFPSATSCACCPRAPQALLWGREEWDPALHAPVALEMCRLVPCWHLTLCLSCGLPAGEQDGVCSRVPLESPRSSRAAALCPEPTPAPGQKELSWVSLPGLLVLPASAICHLHFHASAFGSSRLRPAVSGPPSSWPAGRWHVPCTLWLPRGFVSPKHLLAGKRGAGGKQQPSHLASGQPLGAEARRPLAPAPSLPLFVAGVIYRC